jgi:hypothetical protein
MSSDPHLKPPSPQSSFLEDATPGSTTSSAAAAATVTAKLIESSKSLRYDKLTFNVSACLLQGRRRLCPKGLATTPSLLPHTRTPTPQVQYTMDTKSFWSTIRIFFGVACVVIAIIWFARVRNWQLRNTRMLAVVAQYSQSIASVNYKALVSRRPTSRCPTLPPHLTPSLCVVWWWWYAA